VHGGRHYRSDEHRSNLPGTGCKVSAIMFLLTLVGVIAALSGEWGIVVIVLFLGSCAS
jgi:hypothetical protein